MKKFDSHDYLKKESTSTSKGILTVWESTLSIDDQWDAYLESSPYGHFYQSSMWAQVRTLDGWQPLIIVITLNDQIVGGFQILFRCRSYIGKIGLLLKGPLVSSDNPEILNFSARLLKKITKEKHLRALIIQPADKDAEIDHLLRKSGFSNNLLSNAIKDNTVAIDLLVSEEEVFKRIKRQKRQNINTAIKNCITIREGNKEDVPTFFDYMIKTCARQQVTPSPSNIVFLNNLWDLFSPSGHIKLFMAQHDGIDITGLIVLPFGETAYMWKFGWSGNNGQYRPNELIYWEIFKWAKNNGYKYADVGAISSSLADTAQHDEKHSLAATQTSSRFKNEFGGDVIALSKGYLYFPNPLICFCYNLLMPYINTSPALKKRFIFGE